MAHRSVTHRFPSWLAGALCRGLLGAGFPLSFVGDASGESTTSRWGHMDWADADSINRLGTLIDMMFHNNIVGPADGPKPREVLVGLDFLDRLNAD